MHFYIISFSSYCFNCSCILFISIVKLTIPKFHCSYNLKEIKNLHLVETCTGDLCFHQQLKEIVS